MIRGANHQLEVRWLFGWLITVLLYKTETDIKLLCIVCFLKPANTMINLNI